MASHKPFTRGQTQVLYRHLPQAIFEHDDYGLCKVESVTQSDVPVNREALFDALSGALSQWATQGFHEKYPDPRDEAKRSRYSVGAPREVRFEPYPLNFCCRKCGRVASYDRLQKAGGAPGKCPHCSGSMSQVRYVQAHNCGRLEELKLPFKKCPNGHGPEHLMFYDPGRVRQARWRCRLCGADIQGMRMTPCKCAYNDSLSNNTPPYEKWLKVIPTGDPSLYIAHTLAFVNFPEDAEARFRAADGAHALWLARVWRLLDKPVAEVLKQRAESKGADSDSEVEELIEALRAANPHHPKVREYDARKAQPPGQAAIDKVAALLGSAVGELSGPPRRWLTEHVTLLDRTSITTVPDVARILHARGDDVQASEIEVAATRAADLLGIQSIQIINDFPLALCAFGYTRTAREPSRAVINPFAADENGKFPLYVVASETEALWFQLDPIRVVSWLVANGLAAGPTPSSADTAWAWLFVNVPGLRESVYQPNYGDSRAVAVRTLLHTMSHVFLKRIEWSGFAPSSIGEYLIPGTLSFILYANRYAETKIGGLTTLFEQRLSTWLWDGVQSGRECIYDPICTDEGGSCAGCTHREHNCVAFNRELSRAMLYGGPTPQHGEFDGALLREGYWSQAWAVMPEK